MRSHHRHHRRGRVLFGLACGLLAVLAGAPAADAHPGPVDGRGGHYCRPAGGGAADCTAQGVEPGRYHCEQDPCMQVLLERAEDWCEFGVPYPTASNLTGLYPEEPFVPPIRVVNLGGPGHVLVVERAVQPLVDPPEACVDALRALPLHLPPATAAAHVAADGAPPPFGAADPVSGAAIARTTTASSTAFTRLGDEPTAPGRQHGAAAAAAVAALFAMSRLGRRRICWQRHGR